MKKEYYLKEMLSQGTNSFPVLQHRKRHSTVRLWEASQVNYITTACITFKKSVVWEYKENSKKCTYTKADLSNTILPYNYTSRVFSSYIPYNKCKTWMLSTLPLVMYLQLIFRNFSVNASSSSEVDDTTLVVRTHGCAGEATDSFCWTPSGS